MHVRCKDCGRVVPTTQDGRLYTHPVGDGVCSRSGEKAEPEERQALLEDESPPEVEGLAANTA
ncbi:MAG: hypothetical protein MI919_37355 [Holophagales bacterium]|nr:hypothetical protein [Holophagales bacterium]